MTRHPDPPSPLPVAVEPESEPALRDAVTAGGGTIVPVEQAVALIWTGHGPAGLPQLLDRGAGITWVQLPSAGIERYADVIDGQHLWTCAKEIYGRAVAEHALALALAGLHQLPKLARAHHWEKTLCRDLSGGTVTIVGGGGIAQQLIALLAPFDVTITVVRRHAGELEGVTRVLPSTGLEEALPHADVVVLAAPLTAETRGMIGAEALHAMKDDAWLVNVARGGLVQTDALITALQEEWIGGAALDVTDPEPLPDDNPLWDLPNCLITPHCANPPPLERANYARLVEENVRRRIQGKSLSGVVDPELGY